MVECTGFENLHDRNVIASSNLAPTAKEKLDFPVHSAIDKMVTMFYCLYISVFLKNRCINYCQL